MTQPLRIATDEAVERLTGFWRKVQRLEKKYSVEIVCDGAIWLNDPSRNNENFPYLASINKQNDIDFDEISAQDFPEEYAELKAAKVKGQAW